MSLLECRAVLKLLGVLEGASKDNIVGLVVCNVVMTARNLTDEEREAVWDEISDDVSALLQGQRELPVSAMPFDAASTITIEQQRSDQLLTY